MPGRQLLMTFPVTATSHLLAEYRALEEEYSGQDEYPEEIDARLGQLEMAMEALEQRPLGEQKPEIGGKAGHGGSFRGES